jgi:hypothetical protein
MLPNVSVFLEDRKAPNLTLHQGIIEVAYIVLPLLALQWLLPTKLGAKAR